MCFTLTALPAFADTDAEAPELDMSASSLGRMFGFLNKYIFGFGTFVNSIFGSIVTSPQTSSFLKNVIGFTFARDNIFARFLKSLVPIKPHKVDLDTNDDNKINYVSLGASNVNGFGMRGYLPGNVYEVLEKSTDLQEMMNLQNQSNVFGYKKTPEGAYPYKVQQALHLATGMEVELDQMAISSMRVEEIRVLLDDSFEGDSYTKWRFTGNGNWFEKAATFDDLEDLDGLRDIYQKTIAAADVITLDIGVNNFGVFLINHSQYKDIDFDDIIDNSIYFDENLRSVYYAAKDIIKSMITPEGSEDESDTASEIGEAFAYTFVSYCMNFDAVVKRIYELNPDVKLAVVNIQNVLEGIVMEYKGLEIPVGDIYGAIIDIANVYTAVVSPFSHKYNYAYLGNDGQVDLFANVLAAYDGDPTELSDDIKDCFDLYDDGLLVQTRVRQATNDENKDAFDSTLNAAYDTVAKILQAGLTVNTVDIAAIGDTSEAEDAIMDYIVGAVKYILDEENDGKFDLDTPIYVKRLNSTISCNDIINNPDYATVVAIGVRTSIGNSFFSHPSPKGHDMIKDAVMNALLNDIDGEEAMEHLGASYLVDGGLLILKLISKIGVPAILEKLAPAA